MDEDNKNMARMAGEDFEELNIIELTKAQSTRARCVEMLLSSASRFVRDPSPANKKLLVDVADTLALSDRIVRERFARIGKCEFSVDLPGKVETIDSTGKVETAGSTDDHGVALEA